MALFHRQRRVDLGTFHAPPVPPLAPIEQVIDEGVLIATSTIRMSLKNRLIVAALRDDHEYDPKELSRVVRDEFIGIAIENEESAARAEDERNSRSRSEKLDAANEFQKEQRDRRPDVQRELAAALRRAARDRARILTILEGARQDAWDEIGGEAGIVRRSEELSKDHDADYERGRARRLRKLIQVDLATLETMDSHETQETQETPETQPGEF